MKQLRKTFSFAAVILFMVAMCPMKMQAKIVKWHNAANATVTSLQLGIIAPENGAPVAPTPAAQNAVALTTDISAHGTHSLLTACAPATPNVHITSAPRPTSFTATAKPITSTMPTSTSTD